MFVSQGFTLFITHVWESWYTYGVDYYLQKLFKSISSFRIRVMLSVTMTLEVLLKSSSGTVDLVVED